MADEVKTIRIIVDAGRAVDGSAAATRAMEKLERQQAATTSALERMEASLGRVGNYMKAQVALMAAEAVARLVQFGKSALDAAANMDELAEQLGTNARHLQGLQYAAVQANVKLEQLDTGLSKFSIKLGEAADGSKEVIDSLDRLGVKNLDVAGKLRPTEDVLTDVARAIMGIEDPAKRSAAAVDFFGKTGTKMLPMLAEMAKGQDALAASAERAGAMIGGYTSQRLDQMGDAASRAGLKLRKLFADSAVEILDWAERNISAIERIPIIGGIVQVVRNFDEVKAALNRMLEGIGDFTDSARAGLDGLYIAGARFAAGFGEAIRTIPEQLGKAFVDGMNLALDAMEGGLRKLTGALERNAPWLGVKESAASFGRLSGGGASLSDRNAAIRAAEDQAEADMRARGYGQDYAAARLAARAADAASAFYGSEGGRLPTIGARTSAMKGAGEDVADRRRKALDDAARELEQARAFADIAGQGAEAVAKLELHFKSVKTAQDVFGKTANDNAAEVKKLADRLEGTAVAAQKLKGLGDFSVATVELEKANQLLATENALINATTEDRARGLALVKLQQEVQSKGLDETDAKEREAIERRREAISVNERLKGQGEEIRKAQEMWTEPLKNALQSLQGFTADWLDGMLEKGAFTFTELANFGRTMARRIIAEFASLAIIRPAIGSMMAGMTSLGIVSPATAANLGYGGGYGGSSISMPATGGLGGFGMGNITGSLGSFGQWLNTPLTGPYAGMSPASMQGVPMLSPSMTNPSSWGITPLQGIGAIAGIGSGIFQLATGNGSTGSMIGGIGSMIGGAVSLIPGIGQIAGPIIGILSALGGSRLGGGQQSYVDNQAYGQLNYGGGGWSTSGGAWGPNADARSLQQPLSQLGQSLDGIFGMLGGVKDPGKVWGFASETSSRTGGGWDLHQKWSYLIDPASGAKSLWRAGEDNMMESGGAQIAVRSILGGAVGQITEAMRTAIYTVGQRGSSGTLGQVAEAVQFVGVYEKLGKAAVPAKDAIEQLAAQFGDMAAKASSFGLSLAPIDAEREKQTKRYAQDYIDAMLDPQAVALRELEDQQKASLASAEYIRDNVKDVYVDMARITEYWNTKRLDLEAQYQEQSVGQLQALVRRLTYGDLANASPDTSLSGTRGTYEATLAQARAGSGSARANLAGYAEAYATSARSYFASSAEYDAIVAGIRNNLSEIAGSSGGGGASTAAMNAANQETAELRGMVAALVEKVSRQSDEISALTAQLQRRG